MARELLRPEEATNWDDFLERIALERSFISERQNSFPPAFWGQIGTFLLVLSLLFISYAAGWHGQWWELVAAAAPLVVVARMAARAVSRADKDRERLRELDRLEQGWKSHLEHARH